MSRSTPLRSARCRMLSRIGSRSVGSTTSRPSPRAKPRYSSTSLDISPTSWRSPASTGSSPCPSSSSSSCMRVKGVRRSWLTAASISVRWLMWRRMRWRIRLKAWAAWRISRAPRGRKSPTSRPLPKLSAARASWRIGRTCRRRKKIEIAERTIELPTIQAKQQPGRGAGDPLARGDDPQQAGLDLDEDRDPVGIVGLQVDGERVGQALREGFQDLGVDVADLGPDAGGRHGLVEAAVGYQGDVEVGAAARPLDEGVAGGGAGCFLDRLGKQRHLAGDAEGQPPGHRVPVAVVEDVGEQDLQDEQRDDDDQERAPEQAARDDQAAEPAAQRSQHRAQLPSRST